MQSVKQIPASLAMMKVRGKEKEDDLQSQAAPAKRKRYYGVLPPPKTPMGKLPREKDQFVNLFCFGMFSWFSVSSILLSGNGPVSNNTRRCIKYVKYREKHVHRLNCAPKYAYVIIA